MDRLQEAFDALHDAARDEFSKSGVFPATVLAIDAAGHRLMIACPTPRTESDRDLLAAYVADKMRAFHAVAYAYAAECWLSAEANRLAQKAGYVTLRPSEMSDRVDGLHIIACDREGHGKGVAYEVRKAEAGVTLVPREEIVHGEHQRMGGRWAFLLGIPRSAPPKGSLRGAPPPSSNAIN